MKVVMVLILELEGVLCNNYGFFLAICLGYILGINDILFDDLSAIDHGLLLGYVDLACYYDCEIVIFIVTNIFIIKLKKLLIVCEKECEILYVELLIVYSYHVIGSLHLFENL